MEGVSAALVLVVAFTAIASFIIGYDLCIVSSILKVITTEFDLCLSSSMNCFRKAFFVSMLPPGAALGSLVAGIFSDVFGRKYGLMLGDLLIALGSICFYLGKTYQVLLLGRFIIGTGIGIGFVVFSIYVPEISPAKYRGALVAAQDCALSIGCLFSYLIIAVVDVKHWRFLLGGVGVAAIAQFIGAFLLPESPRWLVRRDRSGDAVRSVKRLLPVNIRHVSDDHHHSAERQVARMAEEFEAEKKSIQLAKLTPIAADRAIQSSTSGSDFQEIHSSKNHFQWRLQAMIDYLHLMWQYRSQVLIAVGCAVAQNLTVSNSVMYFSLDVLNDAGVHNDVLSGVGIGSMKFLGVFSTILLVDRVGRKILLLGGSIVTCLCLYVLALLYLLKELQVLDLPVLTLIDLLIYIYAWNISWAGLMFVVASEVLASTVRAAGMALTITTFWMLSFLFQTTLEPTVAVFTPKLAFAFFGTLNIFSILFVIFFIKDYTGVALEDVE